VESEILSSPPRQKTWLRRLKKVLRKRELVRRQRFFFGKVSTIDAVATEIRGNSAKAQATEMHHIAIRPVTVLDMWPTNRRTFARRASIATPMLISETTPKAMNR